MCSYVKLRPSLNHVCVCVCVCMCVCVCVYVCMYVCIYNNNSRYFFVYKLLAPPKHGVRSQFVQKSSQKELQSKPDESD